MSDKKPINMGKVTIRTKKSFEFNETALYVIADALTQHYKMQSNELVDLMKTLLIKHYSGEPTATAEINLYTWISRFINPPDNEPEEFSFSSTNESDNEINRPDGIIYDHVSEDIPESTKPKEKKSDEKKTNSF